MNDKPKTETPLRRGGFTFKQFFIAHDRCAMKVGTDGVILGAWVNIERTQRVLDIGCGSGLIALMIAQRTATDVFIDAVELDEAAAIQARDNVRASPWPEKVTVHHQDIHHFVAPNDDSYDLIVSNPPYFEPAVACRDSARADARYTQKLTHRGLLDCAQRLISDDGRFCLILPYRVGENFQQQARQQGWYSAHRLTISDRDDTANHRMILTLTRQKQPEQQAHLVIKNTEGGYSAQFCQLIGDFYLHY
ncbi:tRNA(1)(Val) (adenine(37)-N(6))-methyltransferase TrmN [Serratia microhaemolytica]|uniref:tRNA(1)(Val) (adenine(37)-N(6))-methyltransferase TrmN n=1 Tax=Serratia microhaemolytica TaxID=2675110 RepID=UPI001981B4E2|nr:tRNA1(Val) (adenine(37)-N6)-methyltransferase [Serratia microhaemolytica]